VVNFATPHQPACNDCRLKCCALGGRVGGEIAGNSDQDVSTGGIVTPLSKLAHASLDHLVGMKARIFSQQSTGERRDQLLRRVAEAEVPGDEARCGIDLVLAIECIKQSSADFLD
jgi:hypothetical protein